jgi:lycopene cyclase domain-containing protein
VLITLPLELGPRRYGFGVRVWRRPRRLLAAIGPVFVVFVVWDLWATHHGTWSFAEEYTVGLRLPGDMAIEELGFFVVIPVCGLLTLETVRSMLARMRARCRPPIEPGTAPADRPEAVSV